MSFELIDQAKKQFGASALPTTSPSARSGLLLGFRKITGGFRSEWGPSVNAGYISTTSTARIAGQTAFGAISDIAATIFAPAPQIV